MSFVALFKEKCCSDFYFIFLYSIVTIVLQSWYQTIRQGLGYKLGLKLLCIAQKWRISCGLCTSASYVLGLGVMWEKESSKEPGEGERVTFCCRFFFLTAVVVGATLNFWSPLVLLSHTVTVCVWDCARESLCVCVCAYSTFQRFPARQFILHLNWINATKEHRRTNSSWTLMTHVSHCDVIRWFTKLASI